MIYLIYDPKVPITFQEPNIVSWDHLFKRKADWTSSHVKQTHQKHVKAPFDIFPTWFNSTIFSLQFFLSRTNCIIIKLCYNVSEKPECFIGQHNMTSSIIKIIPAVFSEMVGGLISSTTAYVCSVALAVMTVFDCWDYKTH